ncbi:MAG: hypothetical protein ACH37Z_18785 [Anaerolineae bacterium]
MDSLRIVRESMEGGAFRNKLGGQAGEVVERVRLAIPDPPEEPLPLTQAPDLLGKLRRQFLELHPGAGGEPESP